VKDELHMDAADLLRLLRVSKFAELQKDKTMK
jgi:Ca2+-binding EF-hand superfamily protein